MPFDFDHRTLGQRVRFGTGAAATNLADEVSERGSRRVMLIATRNERAVAQRLAADIEVALVYTDVAPHVPAQKATIARTAAAEAGVDLLVSVGGGSTTGLAKAIALTTRIPIVAIPTTYAGSEATNVWGVTDAARKTTGVDDSVLPQTVIYDAELTLGLPTGLSIASGLNGIAHCVDSMWAPRTDPIARALAEEGIRALANGLTGIAADGAALEGRELALYGAYVSAVAFAAAGSGLHHKICHVLGGRFDLPHAQTHTTILPHVLALNAPACPEGEARIARALAAPSAVEGLDRLYDILGAPRALGDFGLRRDQLTESVELILPVVPPSNPRPITRDDLYALLEAALDGRRPMA